MNKMISLMFVILNDPDINSKNGNYEKRNYFF